MSKKNIGRLVLLAVIILFSFSLYTVYQKMNKAKQVSERISALPSLPMVDLDSATYTFPDDGNRIALVHFNSTCEHCHAEARDIRQNASSVDSLKVIFVSTESIEEIKGFAAMYGFENIENVAFVKVSPESLYSAFGSVSTPHVYLYDGQHALIKEFKGEVRFLNIIKHL